MATTINARVAEARAEVQARNLGPVEDIAPLEPTTSGVEWLRVTLRADPSGALALCRWLDHVEVLDCIAGRRGAAAATNPVYLQLRSRNRTLGSIALTLPLTEEQNRLTRGLLRDPNALIKRLAEHASAQLSAAQSEVGHGDL